MTGYNVKNYSICKSVSITECNIFVDVHYFVLSSPGPAGTLHSDKMGLYEKTQLQNNNIPVYKLVGGQHLIFVDSDGVWRVGSLFTYQESGLRSGSSSSSSPVSPYPPATGWQYWDQQWTDDQEILLSPRSALVN